MSVTEQLDGVSGEEHEELNHDSQVSEEVEVCDGCGCVFDEHDDSQKNLHLENPSIDLPSFRGSLHTVAMDNIVSHAGDKETYTEREVAEGISQISGDVVDDMDSENVNPVLIECDDYDVLCDMCAIDEGVDLERVYPANIIEPVISNPTTNVSQVRRTESRRKSVFNSQYASAVLGIIVGSFSGLVIFPDSMIRFGFMAVIVLTAFVYMHVAKTGGEGDER